MPVYILRRLASAVVVLFSVTVLTFAVARFVPSDPAALFAGPRPTQEQIDRARDRLGLDRPLYLQYASFMGAVLAGDLGVSFRTRRDILTDVAVFFPATLELVIAAMLIAVAIGVPVGVLAAAKPGGGVDQASRVLAIAGVSAPAFWLAMILQLVFFRELGLLPLSGRLSNAVALNHPVTTITGMLTLDALLTGNWVALRDAAAHLVLPAVTLAAYPLGLTMRMTRASVAEALGERYVLAATALGLRRHTVLVSYALRNALAPTLTLVGLCFAFSLTGAFLTEIVFSWPGLGRYVAEAILAVDFPVIMAVTLIVTAAYVLVNLAVDLAQALLDPRIVRR